MVAEKRMEALLTSMNNYREERKVEEDDREELSIKVLGLQRGPD